MKLTIEDKRKIAARLFYDDNKDQYDDFQHAQVEFMGSQKPPDSFVEFTVEAIAEPEDGYVKIMNNDGHVAKLRTSDGFFEPITEMTEADGEKIQEDFEEAADKYPDVDEKDIIYKIGWKAIHD